MRASSGRRPVFLDSTGRRRRLIRRAGALLAIPSVGYLALMVSSLVDGPRLDTPFIPLPDAAKHQPKPRPTPHDAAVPTPGSTRTPDGSSSDEGQPADGGTTTGATPIVNTPGGPTAVPTTIRTPRTTGAPTPTPSARTPGENNGKKPTAPPGQTRTPNKP